MPYEPALDGLRALSVIAVICYHAGFTWMHGGFVGVEVFFVVSGYLITALLLDERDRSRRTNLPQFWLRRARRLLPALFMMLMVTAVWAMIAGTAAERAQLRRDLPWAIFYAGNWGQIIGGVPYWSADPPLLRHLWSLGVEEQWYLLWPLLFVVLSTLPLRRRAVAVVLAAASLAAMIAMFWLHANGPGPIHSGIGAFDGADRINFMYLATFTRCAGLLLGAAAAHVWRPWRWSRVARHPATNVPLLDAAGGGAVAGLFVIACSVSILDGYVYQWLLALVSILSLVAVLTAVHPGASWHRAALSLPPLVAIGRRSYGLYLWSWPIFVILGATHGSVRRVMVALAVTAVVSEACYRFVELPVRHGALGRWWRRSPPRQRLIPLAWATAAVVAIVAFYATVGPYNRALGGADASFSLPTSTVATATTIAGAATPGVVAATTTSAVADGPLPVVVVGDSTGYALVLNAPDGIDDTFAITDGSIEGCSVYAAGSTRSSNAALDHSFVGCDRWEHEWADAASEGGASVALVVLGAWDVFDLQDGDGNHLTFGTPEWDDYVAGQVRSGIAALVGAGVSQVGLLEVACMRPVPAEGVPAYPERADDARVTHLNALWHEIADADPGRVTFVDGPTEWCNDPAVATDLAYRWDGVHVWKPGSNLIFETIAPELLALGDR